MPTNYKQLGHRIKNVRKRKGLSQMVLAEIIDRSPTYISYIENGQKRMSLDTFLLIANALNVGADELLIDSLNNTVLATNHELASILSDCSEFEKRVIVDVSHALKVALRLHAAYFHTPHP